MIDNRLPAVLEAREQRWNMRQRLAAERGCTIIAITLCLPVGYRTDQAYQALFRRLVERFALLFAPKEGTLRGEGHLEGADGPAAFFSAPGDPFAIKAACVLLEQSLPGGRMLDIDVMAPNGRPVGRAQAGLPPRACYLCQNAAAICVAGRLHTREEIDQKVKSLYREAKAALG